MSACSTLVRASTSLAVGINDGWAASPTTTTTTTTTIKDKTAIYGG